MKELIVSAVIYLEFKLRGKIIQRMDLGSIISSKKKMTEKGAPNPPVPLHNYPQIDQLLQPPTVVPVHPVND